MLFNHQISQIKNIRFKEFIIEFDLGFSLIFKEICKDNYFIDYDIFRSDVNVHTSTSVIEAEAWQGIKKFGILWMIILDMKKAVTFIDLLVE